MKIFQTIKRRMTLSDKPVDRFIGYCNTSEPCLHFSMTGGYAVEITFRDLAQLVAKADELASKAGRDGIPESIRMWRELA